MLNAVIIFSSLSTKLLLAIERYVRSLTVDSKSAPVNPSVSSTILSAKGPIKSRFKYLRMYSEIISRRSSDVGKSMKNNSSNLPLRKSSDGSIETSFAVATTNTCFLHSCSQNKNYPTIRVDTPPSFEPPAPDKPFSISSIHRMQGDTFSAVVKASFSCCSDWPT